MVGYLPSDNDDLALDSHGLDGRREHLVRLVGQGGEVLHLVCGGHGWANLVLGADGDGDLHAAGHLALGGVDRRGDLGLADGIRLENRVADREASLGRGRGSRQDRGLARSHARDARSVACSEHGCR